MKIKTVDVTVKEWFDKVNGNSYFAGSVTVNFGMKSAKTFDMPFQYGYGDHYKDMAFELLQEKGIIPKVEKHISYWTYYLHDKITSHHTKHENCLKRELQS